MCRNELAQLLCSGRAQSSATSVEINMRECTQITVEFIAAGALWKQGLPVKGEKSYRWHGAESTIGTESRSLVQITWIPGVGIWLRSRLATPDLRMQRKIYIA